MTLVKNLVGLVEDIFMYVDIHKYISTHIFIYTNTHVRNIKSHSPFSF